MMMKKIITHNGIEFEVPVGYRTIQDFADTVRLYLFHPYKDMGLSKEKRKEYEALQEKFKQAGL